MGGWVGGWVGGEETYLYGSGSEGGAAASSSVGERSLWVGGWVDRRQWVGGIGGLKKMGWVGGWVGGTYLYCQSCRGRKGVVASSSVREGRRKLVSHKENPSTHCFCMGGWVGGWVGGRSRRRWFG